MDKKYKMPAVAWLKVTDYMLGWLQSELGGTATIREQHVICLQHLAGVREIMKKESIEDGDQGTDVSYAMTATKRNCIETGLRLDAKSVENTYHLNREMLSLYIPVECPRMCVTKNGVVRPWTLDTGFSREQATLLLKLLRDEFWRAVSEFNREYSRQKQGAYYTAKEMMEAFCTATGTSDVYLEALRREWQRRVKRTASPTLANPHPRISPSL